MSRTKVLLFITHWVQIVPVSHPHPCKEQLSQPGSAEDVSLGQSLGA